MSTKSEPNHRLASLMAEAKISNKGLAARVRALAGQDGRSVSSDHVSVRRWLDGSMPRGRTAEYIARALSIKLGRRVTPADIGLNSYTSTTARNDLDEYGKRYSDKFGDALRSLRGLTTADLDNPESVLALRWSSDATATTISGYLFGESNITVARTEDLGKPLTAAAIRRTTQHLTDLDFCYGGG